MLLEDGSWIFTEGAASDFFSSGGAIFLSLINLAKCQCLSSYTVLNGPVIFSVQGSSGLDSGSFYFFMDECLLALLKEYSLHSYDEREGEVARVTFLEWCSTYNSYFYDDLFCISDWILYVVSSL